MRTLMIGFLVLALRAHAQNVVDWVSLDAGGNQSLGTSITISATIGQGDAYVSASANYAFVGGFWAIESSTASGQPRLYISHEPPNVRIWWASPSTGFVLQQNNNLGNAGGWSAVGMAPTDNGVIKAVVLGAGGNPAFFRLRKP